MKAEDRGGTMEPLDVDALSDEQLDAVIEIWDDSDDDADLRDCGPRISEEAE